MASVLYTLTDLKPAGSHPRDDDFDPETERTPPPWAPAAQCDCRDSAQKMPREILTWERGHSLANVLWFISLSSSFKALRTVAWFHCSAGKSSSFEQLQNRARVSNRQPSAMVLAAGDTRVPCQCHSRTFRRLP